SLKTSIKTITYLSDIGCLEIQGASLADHYNCHLNIDGGVDASDWLTSTSLDSKRSHLCGCA
ncbi:hypothetical protein, partial [Salmonella sp. NW285]|uniref:hypothetical protein n=1 Tax=unclassified Salmonella TaxID=2614656 RepID=UPI003F434063